MTLYCGIDLHCNNSVISIINDEDKVTYERRLPTQPPTILKAIMPYQDKVKACVVESTYNWYWLVGGLMAQGVDVRLANTAAIVQYSGIKQIND